MRPRVLLNCAVSQDGRLAGAGGRPVLLSDPVDLQRVHRMRVEADAILVGIGTILADDPGLRVKSQHAHGPDPLRVVLDSTARTPPDARVRPALILHGPAASDPEGVAVALASPGRIDIADALAALAARGVRTLMVEGGAAVLRSFVASGAWDIMTVYEAPVILGAGPILWTNGQPDGMQATSVPAGQGILHTYARVNRG